MTGVQTCALRSPSGGTGATASNLAAGTYTVTVTDSKGCTKSCSYTVTQPPVLVANCSGTNVSCNGGSDGTANVLASGGTTGYTYSWSPSGGTGATASNLAAGTYTVTVTDSKGCTKSCAYTVTQPTAVTADCSKKDASCNGASDGSASVVAGGGTPGYTYSWLPSGGTGASATGLKAGTYTVTVTDSKGCTASCSATVGEPAALTIDCSKITQPTCAGKADGSVTSTFSGGTPPYTASINGGTPATVTSPYTFPSLGSGSYEVVIMDANGCTIKCNPSLVAPPQILILSPVATPESCAGAKDGCISVTIDGGTPPYDVTINGMPMTDQGDGVTFKKCGLSAGTYTINVIDANKCVEQSTEVVLPPGPDCGGHIFPTQTTCCNYLTNTVTQLLTACYTPSSPSNGSISNAIPGVFFYFTKVVAPSANFTITVDQTKDIASFKYFAVHKLQINLYSNGCIQLATVVASETSTGQSQLVVTGATPGATYVLQVKYNTKSIIGSTYTGVAPVATYSFITKVDGTVVPNSDGSIKATPNCQDNTPLPGDCTLPPVTRVATPIVTTTLGTETGIKMNAYPNPYRDRISFNFVSPVSGRATLEVYNLAGQRLAVVFDGSIKAGIANSVNYNAQGKASGMIIYKLNVDGKVVRGKIQQIQ